MKKIIILLAAAVMMSAGCSADGTGGSGETVKEIRIGIQQSLSPLLIAKEKGWFEEAFKKDGIKVKWVEFQSGPPQFEGLAADKLDFSQVGNSPVISGQAAGIDFKEIGLSQDGLKANGILVNKGSGIQSLKELKGKKIAVAKGSSGFDFLYKALDKAGFPPMTSLSSSFSLMRRFPLLKTNQLTHGPFGSRICRLKRCSTGRKYWRTEKAQIYILPVSH